MVSRRTRSAVLWGAVGALAFLVIAQGYILLGWESPSGPLVRVGIAIGIGTLVTITTYLTEHRLIRKGRT